MPDTYLTDKVLVMIIGPTAIGKSTVMHEVTRSDSDFSYARSFTTRPQRSGESPTYRHISLREAESLRDSGAAYTYLTHPTTGTVYGTDALTFVNAYTVLDTLSDTVDMYRSLPFARTVAISLTTDPEQWEDWLLQRFPTPSKDRDQRLREARQSVLWSLGQSSGHSWVSNRPGKPALAAAEIIRIARTSREAPQAPAEAEKMLQTIDRLLSYQ